MFRNGIGVSKQTLAVSLEVNVYQKSTATRVRTGNAEVKKGVGDQDWWETNSKKNIDPILQFKFALV